MKTKENRIIKWTAIGMAFIFMLAACGVTPLNQMSAERSEGQPGAETAGETDFTDLIGQILENPKAFNEKEVTIVGYYHGWNLLGEAEGESPVTRSDWVVKDTSGALYVEANEVADSSLKPEDKSSTEIVIRVSGVVRMTASGQPYLEPTALEILAQPEMAEGDAEIAFSTVIGQILENPKGFIGEEVTIIGYYRGWDLLGEAEGESPVTRSDWVVKDASGALYVQANEVMDDSLTPGSKGSTNRIIRVTGMVRVSGSGQPYLEPSAMEVLN